MQHVGKISPKGFAVRANSHPLPVVGYVIEENPHDWKTMILYKAAGDLHILPSGERKTLTMIWNLS